MVTQEESSRALRYAYKDTQAQKVWNYMRRNRTFRFGDVLAVVGVTHKYLNNILWHLKAVGYVKEHEKAKPYSSTMFTLVKCTGAKCPSMVNGVVYDYNTKERFECKRTPVVIKLLQVMQEDVMSKQRIIKESGVSKSSAKRWFKVFKEEHVMFECDTPTKCDGYKAFGIDRAKVKEFMERYSES